MKLFEQYEEIMEGYVQIDHCLTQCERIAAEVADALAIWRGASQQQDGSVVGTPRTDGLNDVKVDVAKVSELLRKETDQRKRKVLGMYIQKQPSTLSEGTVLKDYQLLGVNWLNLLWTKKIGCILADEMGQSDVPLKISLLTMQVSARRSRSLPSSLTFEKEGMLDPTSFSSQLRPSKTGFENLANSLPTSMSTRTTEVKVNERIYETTSRKNSEAVNYRSYSLHTPKWSRRMISAFSGKRSNFNRVSTTRVTSSRIVRPRLMLIYFRSNLDGDCC
jgi:hypothetical protein